MRTLKVFLIILSTLGLVMQGCSAEQQTRTFADKDPTQKIKLVSIKKKSKESLTRKDTDNLEEKPLDKELEQTARLAQEVILKRINGTYPDIFDASMFRSMESPLWPPLKIPLPA